MVAALFLGSGVFWTLTYVLIIHRGFRDHTYGMPVVALCANLSWEFIFTVVRPPGGVQHVVDAVWLGLDVIIAVTVLRYGPREFPGVPRTLFFGGLAVTLALSYLAVDLVSREFDAGAGSYAAFGQNLMMSALFLAMLTARYGRWLRTGPGGTAPAAGALAGQSVWIAAAKLVGTGLASLGSWRGGDYAGSSVLAYLYVATALLDLAYLVAVPVVGAAARRRGDAVPAAAAPATAAPARPSPAS